MATESDPSPEPELATPEAGTSTVPMPEGPAAVEMLAQPANQADPAGRRTRTRAGSVGVSLVLVAAGLLFTTSAATAHGTQLRSDRTNLADLLMAENSQVAVRAQRVAALNDEVDREAAANSANNQAIRTLESRAAGVIDAAGLRPVSGPGLTVTLNDAPRDVPIPAQAGPDDLVVHQQDVEAVVNALWAGGGEAMMLQDQRVISTSAVHCVGNTLILQGRVYSPPYTVTVIGDPAKLEASMAASVQIDYYLEYVASLRLGWSVKKFSQLNLPAYAGSLTLSHARVAGQSAGATTGSTGTSPSPSTP